MKVLVLGAGGKTGSLLVDELARRGHSVQAFMRESSSAAFESDIEVIRGDASNHDDIARAAVDCDAVVSGLGHTSATKSSALSDAAASLVKVLAAGTPVVTLTGFGVPDALDPAIPLSGRIMNQIIKLVPGGMYHDGYEQTQVLKQSSLNWTVIRAPRLTMDEKTASYELGYFKLGANESVSRYVVARAMVDCLERGEWVQKSPMIRSEPK